MTDLQALKHRVDELEARLSRLENSSASLMDATDDAWTHQLYELAKKLVIQHRRATATFLQRKLLIDYERAEKILGKLEHDQIIGPANNSGPRQVLVDH